MWPGVLNVSEHWIFTALFVFYIATSYCFFCHDWFCKSRSFLTVIDLCILSLRQKESVDLFYISSSAREMTSVESQHEREWIIRRIKGIFTSWLQSFCRLLRNAAITVCIAKLSCVLWAKWQSGYSTASQSAHCRVKSVCWQKCMLAGICSYIYIMAQLCLLGVCISSCLSKTLISPHFRLTIAIVTDICSKDLICRH